jgi:diguanylate cyclase (GGDEF)-like protein
VHRTDDSGILDITTDIADTSWLRMREATITTGVWLSYIIGGLGGVYVALTWSRPNRAALAILFGATVAATIAISLLPRARIVHSRYREAFFLSWTVMDFVLIVLGTLADGGTASPLVLILFVPVVFSSMSYPLRSVLVVGILSVDCYLTLAVVAGGASWSYEAAFAVVLACTSVISAWQAQNHGRQREALVEISRTDPLTGCLNRRGFEERAVAEIGAAARKGAHGAIMVLDLDYFKLVNDRHGHAAGDELLCWVVEQVKLMIRPSDAVGRLGGDEFAVLFSEIGPTDALASAAGIAEALREWAPSSLGVATYPLDGTDLEDLIHEADMRLYHSARRPRPAPRRTETRASAGAPCDDQLLPTRLRSARVCAVTVGRLIGESRSKARVTAT